VTGNGNGIIGTGNVTNVQVTCTPLYRITVIVDPNPQYDLSDTSDSAFLSDGVDAVTVDGNANGGGQTITFPTALPPGTYTVSVSYGTCGALSTMCGLSVSNLPAAATAAAAAAAVVTQVQESVQVTLGPNATVVFNCFSACAPNQCCPNQCCSRCCG
jgi:hypothetical protein